MGNGHRSDNGRVDGISVDYKIDMDDLKAALDTEERSRLENEDDYTMILVNIPVVEEENWKKWYETIPLGIFITRKIVFTVCLKQTNILKQFVDGLVSNFYTYEDKICLSDTV